MAQLAIIKQMNRQVSRGSAGEYQTDEYAGVAGVKENYRSYNLTVCISKLV